MMWLCIDTHNLIFKENSEFDHRKSLIRKNFRQFNILVDLARDLRYRKNAGSENFIVIRFVHEYEPNRKTWENLTQLYANS